MLLESAFREIHSLRVGGDGVIYAVAVAAKGGGTSDERPPDTAAGEPIRAAASASVSAEITGFAVIDVAAPAAADQKSTAAKVGPRGSRGAVYRIQPDGLWDIVWESADDTPYDVAFAQGGGLLVATGPKGKIFRVTGDPPQVTLVGRAPAQQVTRFLSRPNGETLLATSNPGKLLRLSPGRAERGTLRVGRARRADRVDLGRHFSWRGVDAARQPDRAQDSVGQQPDARRHVEPVVRPVPQRRRPADPEPEGPLTSSGRPCSSARRPSPVLTSVTAAYLQRNLRPRVTAITVYPPGHVFQKPYSTGEAEIAGFDEGWPDTQAVPDGARRRAARPAPAAAPLGRRIYQKGLQAFSWKAEDDNDDKLQYDVLYRREGETGWKALKRALTDPLFVWDTTSVPDGTYVVRIVASDALSNPPGAEPLGRGRQRRVRHRQHAAVDPRHRRPARRREDGHRVRGRRRPVADPARRLLGRSGPVAARLSNRRHLRFPRRAVRDRRWKARRQPSSSACWTR